MIVGITSSWTSRTAFLVVLLVTFSVALIASASAPLPASAAEKGVIDHRLEWAGGVDLKSVPDLVAEIGPGRLGARWTRISVFWNRLQPEAPGTGPSAEDVDGDGYADDYVKELDTVIADLHAAGISIIMTSFDVPRWASDRRYWPGGVYDPDVAMRIDDATVRAAFATYARFLANRYAGSVHHFEVWNEPNLGSGIFPQWRGKKAVGPLVYLKMLKAFSTAVRNVVPRPTVIAGATAPRGSNNEYGTSPQVFAKYLSDHDASRWFDAYSHHPYTPKGSRNASPSLPPNKPGSCVTLYNLPDLMRVFPGKPFYLTEYGYDTQYSDVCGLLVSHADQARYLREAYARVARWRQVKALLWYLVSDYFPNPADPGHALYLGLIESDGVTRKPSWYAFAGSNRIALSTPPRVAARAAFTVSGTLTTKLGMLEGIKVTLQIRPASGGPWRVRRTTTTLPDGTFMFTVRQESSASYRVIWDGVRESRSRVVRTF